MTDPPSSPPNVLLVTLDQWRADHLGAAGCPLPITPNLDRLAAGGAVFTNHFAQCSPCGPSRASILTGRYLMNHRSVNNGTPLPAGGTNLAQEVRKGGYDPVLFGYTDTSVDPRTVEADDPRLRTYENVMEGFTVGVNVPTEAGPWLEWLRERGWDFTDVWDAYRQIDPAEAAGRGSTWAPVRYPAELSQAAHLTECVLDYLGNQPAPWFVHLTYLQPHPPFVAPEPFHDLVDPADVAPPHRRPTYEEEGAIHPLLGVMLNIDGVRADADEKEIRQLRATYAGMIAEVDAQFGRILDYLDASGQAGNTLVVVTSDHGEQAGDHWLMHKLGWFAESYHIPLVVRWPDGGVTPGRHIDALTENVDLMPTILQATGLPVPPQCDGASLLGHLNGDTPPRWRTEVRWEWDFRDPVLNLPGLAFGLRLDESALAVVRDRNGQYVHFSGAASGMPALYYDLVEDPHCTTNLASDPARAADVLDMAQRMLTWRLQHTGGDLVNTMCTPGGVVTRDDPPRYA
jgi:arylsulfatase A-like enzyme